MLFGLVNWLLDRSSKRTDALPTPFPSAWSDVLRESVPFYVKLPTDEDRAQLERDVFWFIEQKRWTPIDLELDDVKRVVIAAHACLLINRRLDLGVYPRTREIIVRPSAFGDVYAAVRHGRDAEEIQCDRLGEAWYRGPVVLAWNVIEPLMTQDAPRHNVVIHEFAHKVDFLDGYADGTPPLESRRDMNAWVAEFSAEFEKLQKLAAAGKRSDIDTYGATNPAEFFAVVSEEFFCRARTLQDKHPPLYDCLSRFYKQDPTAW